MKRILIKNIETVARQMRETQDLNVKLQRYQYDVYLNGGLFATMRACRMMSFCEGWLARDMAVKDDEEAPVYLGMTMVTGVCHVLGQISNQQKLWCGSPERGIARGWQALLINHPEAEILPLYDLTTAGSLEADTFYRAVIRQVTKVLCNIWDVQSKAKMVSEK